MQLILKGHDYKYAVEQMLSTLFPGEKPEYTGAITGRGMCISLNRGRIYTTAVCIYTAFEPDGDPGENSTVRTDGVPAADRCVPDADSGGSAAPCTAAYTRFSGRAAVRTSLLTDETETDRLCQYIIKNAVYRAVRASGMERPPWGALTGVRPGKLMRGIMKQTHCREEAVRWFETDFDVTSERAELCWETSSETAAAELSLRERDICLYIGIPFCPTRCAYCSFVSQSVEKSLKLVAPFFDALKEEVRAVGQQVRASGLRPVSIYFGGGTPTTLSASQLDELCSLLGTEFDLSALREFTVEAGRPDTITAEKLAALKKHGVDRLSVNPQTMQDSVLETIGRRHTAADIISALNLVRETGGFAVNMDLIAGLPSDTPDGFRSTLEQVIALAPENITVHTLSMKRGSALTLGGGELPTPAEVGAMLDYAYRSLREAGYLPYYLYRQKNMSGGFENTGWTKPGHVNLYNICMMEELCGILAMGGGGSTKLIKVEGGRNLRITAPKYPLEYIEQIGKTCADKVKIGEFYRDS